jgi:hypothetical protein
MWPAGGEARFQATLLSTEVTTVARDELYVGNSAASLLAAAILDQAIEAHREPNARQV